MATPVLNDKLKTAGLNPRRFTLFDYIAMVGFSINMIVVAFIVSHWLAQ